MVVVTVSNFCEEFQNREFTSPASPGELGTVVKMTVGRHLELKVQVVRSKNGFATRVHAPEVVDVVFLAHGGNVTAAKSSPTSGAKQVQSSKIIGFAQIFVVLWQEMEKFSVCQFLAAVLGTKSELLSAFWFSLLLGNG